MKRAHDEISSTGKLRIELEDSTKRSSGHVVSVDKPVRVKIVLVGSDGQALRSDRERQIVVKLCFAGAQITEVPRKDILVLDSPFVPTIASGVESVELSVTLRDVSMSVNGREFCLSAAVADGLQHIEPAVSASFTCVRHHLRIRTDPHWESPWYKDEGDGGASAETRALSFARRVLQAGAQPAASGQTKLLSFFSLDMDEEQGG